MKRTSRLQRRYVYREPLSPGLIILTILCCIGVIIGALGQSLAL